MKINNDKTEKRCNEVAQLMINGNLEGAAVEFHHMIRGRMRHEVLAFRSRIFEIAEAAGFVPAWRRSK